MDILRRRPLFLSCGVFLLASLSALVLSPTAKYLVGGVALMGCILLALWWRIRRHRPARAALSLAAGILICLAFLCSHQAFSHERSLAGMEQSTVEITATVTASRGAGSYLSSYAVTVHTLNGREMDRSAILTCHYVSDLRPGQEIRMTATLLSLEEAAGDGYDATALRGDGYVMGLLSESETDVTILSEQSDLLTVRMANLRRTLSARLNLLVGKGAKGLPSALLLGDRTYLADAVRRDFSRAGIAHLLAISGLHMTLLFGLLAGILRLLRMSKRLRALVLGVSALGYLFLLGFPPSATRAVIMLGVTYLSHLLSTRADPLTSLGLAGAIILAVTPYAVCDAGFWMSFLATLGIVSVIPWLQASLKSRQHSDAHLLWECLRTDLIRLLVALAVGWVAVSFTLFVVASAIGEVGILSPVTTLLTTPLCGLALLLALLCLPLGATSVGPLLGGLLSRLCEWMAGAAGWISAPSRVVVSLRHPAVLPVAVGMVILTLILLIIRLPARRRVLVLLPFAAGWLALGSILAIDSLQARNEVEVSYLQPSSVSEALVLTAGNQALLCDLSNGSLSAMTAAVREAEQCGATELAVLMLTHYHTRTAGALAAILERETVRALWLPVPSDQGEYDCMLSCIEKAEVARVTVRIYRPGESLRVFGEGSMTVETTSISRSEQPVLLVSLDLSPLDPAMDRLVYCGAAVFESDLASRAADEVAAADVVIFGSHGPLVKKPYGGDLRLAPDAEVIFSAYGNTAAYFSAEALPEGAALWTGQRRLILRKQ